MAQVDELARALRSELDFRADNKLRDQLDRDAGEHPEFAEPSAEQRQLGVSEPQMVRGGTGLRITGPYEVLGAFRQGDVVVMVEQNTDAQGLHPPVAVIENTATGYRSACDPTDHDLVLAEAAAAAGDYSRHERRNVEHALRLAGFEQDQAKPGQWIRGSFRMGLNLMMLLPSLLLGRLIGLAFLLPPMVVTNTTKKAWADAWWSAAALGAPSTHAFGLSTTTPAEDGTGITEPSGNAYARVAKTAGTTDFALSTAADPLVKTNATVITWPAATGSWGTVTHCTQHTATTAGTVTDWQALGASQAISAGTTASIAAGSWQSTIT